MMNLDNEYLSAGEETESDGCITIPVIRIDDEPSMFLAPPPPSESNPLLFDDPEVDDDEGDDEDDEDGDSEPDLNDDDLDD